MAARKKNQVPKRLFKHTKPPVLPPGVQVVTNPAGMAKMSDVLEEFVDPYWTPQLSIDEYRGILSLGLIAWNAALFPEDQRGPIIDKLLGAAFGSKRSLETQLGRDLVDTLIRRKLADFADNDRLIVSFELTDTPQGPHLSVASSFGKNAP